MPLDKDVLESDEFKAAVKAAADEAAEAASKALKAKNDELLAEKKAEKKRADEAAKSLEDLAAEVDAMKEKTADESGNVETVKKQMAEKHAKEIEKLNAQLTEKDARLNRAIIDRGIDEALTEANVAPQYRRAAAAMLKTENKIDIADVDGKVSAVVDGKTINDVVSEWSQSDEGKAFVAAADNSGAGASGAGGKGQGPDPTKTPVSQWKPNDKSAYISEHGVEGWQKLLDQQEKAA